MVNDTVDILIGTKSHLDTSVQDFKIIPKNYYAYIKDRTRHGGSVLVSVKDTSSSSQIDIKSPIETVKVHLHSGKSSDIIIGSLYRPPHSTDSALDDLSLSIATNFLVLKLFLEVTLIILALIQH